MTNNKKITREWFVSSATTPANNCVETQFYSDGSVDVRNSNNRTGPVVTFTGPEWKAFLAGAREGEFDLP